MGRTGSLFWILLLLALLFLGPAAILNLPFREISSEESPALRTIVAQERLVDAPAPLPKKPSLDNR